MSLLITLFTSFFKIGIFSYGGGYAIIPLLREEAISRGWLTAAQFTDIVAVSNVTPGPIAINMATYVGYKTGGVSGSLTATLGVCLPSFILVSLAMYFISKVNNSALIKHAFYGLRPAAAGMIMASAAGIAWEEFFPGASLKLSEFIFPNTVSFVSVGVFAAAFLSLFKFKLNPVLVILSGAAISVACGLLGVLP